MEEAAIFRLRGGRKYPVERTGVLTGNIFDVYSEEGKAFWVATSEGVTRYSPPLWRPPAGMEDLDLPVHAIAQDSQGRLWMSATDYVLELEGETWTRHALPAGFHTQTVETRSVVPLTDGRILVRVVREDRADWVLVMDPKSGRFTQFLHPEGRAFTMLAERPAGGVWVGSEVKGTPGFRLDVYDGATFRKVLELGARMERCRSAVRCWKESRERSGWAVPPGASLYPDGEVFESEPA